ncbi:probable VPS74-protein involved in protein-vacuolar targeting [Serendipita indica DSM 11827]|uniref:Probable VPS74-protein involved in protein-vacuolar targeting n=1 Tax=Serendipita indica (strain DSM 11827) TaxID=1109443 RepID=G4TGZ0_SERID|nr:probable VPS74-protein involved in protein-vacuolar targeting [Serendipita indica DSM 11827]
MSAQTGLSRRRVAAASSSNDVDDEEDVRRPPISTTTSTTSEANGSRAVHAGTALAGGSKVAYDPRDLVGASGSGADEEGTSPRLTLLEEILLLGIKDRAGLSSFWNDNISYALRGCILIELALRRRIAMVKDPARRRLPLAERQIEVVSDRQTGETILDEALKAMKAQQDGPGGGVPGRENGETWNVMKIGFQLKQVRERLAKGLVDKGILRTEKRNFLLFDMATHPVADAAVKESIMSRVVALLTARTTTIPAAALPGAAIKGSFSSSSVQPNIAFPITRTVALVCAAYAASVLDNALIRLGYDEREAAFSRCDDLLNEFTAWPLGSGSNSTSMGTARRPIASGSGAGPTPRELIGGLVQAVRGELAAGKEGDDLHFEIIVTVFEIFSRMDSLL